MSPSLFQIVDAGLIGNGLTLVMFLGILLAIAVGRRLGKRILAREGAAGMPSVGSLESAVFALLGLLVAFTFSGALTRYDTRRAQVVDEANAIGTAWLRADLLPASAQPRFRDAIRTYVDSRIATYKKLPDISAAQAEAARSMQLQSEVWSQAMQALRLPDARPGADLLVVPALNQMFDLATVRIVATQMHPPTV